MKQDCHELITAEAKYSGMQGFIISFFLLFKISLSYGEGGGGGESGWGTHVNPWLIHVNVWQKSLQYCKVISLQLIKINLKSFLKLKKSSDMTQRESGFNQVYRSSNLQRSLGSRVN